MPTERWAEFSASDKLDALRRELEGFREHEQRNLQERASRFAAIDKRLDALVEQVEQMAVRLDRLERRNDQEQNR